MKIWQKLILAWGVTSSLLGIISISTIKIDTEIQDQTNEIVHGIVRESQAAGNMFSSIQLIQDLTEKLLIENQTNTAKDSNVKKYQADIEKELNQFESNIKEAKQATIAQKELIYSLRKESRQKQVKIEEQKRELSRLNNLQQQLELYRKEWKFFLENIKQEGELAYSEKKFTEIMSKSISPLVRQYYEDSLSEIIESELITQKLTRENIKLIRNYSLSTLVITLLLFIYIYYSIYAPIKQLKLATFQLGKNFSKYQPIRSKNSDDELGQLTNYFNETIEKLQEKIIDKSYLDNIINSISQSLIVIDNENKIEKINYNTRELLGYVEAELLGKSINYILAPTNSLNIDELIKLDDISDNCFPLDLITKSHQKISVRVYFSSLFDSVGEKQGTICLAMEIENPHLTNTILRKSKEKAKKNTQIQG